jgi:acyl-CoA synthetase (AMP-forming)/AMP-acid ligase II
MAERALSVSAVVRGWAERVPERVCLSFHAGGSVEQVTYGQLARRASAHARLFRERGLVVGDAVVLLAHSAPGFVAAFLGAQEAGLLAVPCPPPEPLESVRRVRERMREILARCRARALLGSGAAPLDGELSAALTETGAAVLVPPDADAGDPEHGAGDAHEFPLAYCQFTSGSGGRSTTTWGSSPTFSCQWMAALREKNKGFVGASPGRGYARRAQERVEQRAPRR